MQRPSAGDCHSDLSAEQPGVFLTSGSAPLSGTIIAPEFPMTGLVMTVPKVEFVAMTTLLSGR